MWEGERMQLATAWLAAGLGEAGVLPLFPCLGTEAPAALACTKQVCKHPRKPQHPHPTAGWLLPYP